MAINSEVHVFYGVFRNQGGSLRSGFKIIGIIVMALKKLSGSRDMLFVN